MKRSGLIELYNREQRQHLVWPGVRREATPEVVRYVSLEDGHSFVLFSALTEANADAVIREQIAYFEGLGQSFEWKYYSCDQPADLLARLAAHGFEVEEREAILVLDLDEAPADLWRPPPHQVVPIEDPAQFGEVLAVQQVVFGDGEELAQQLRQEVVEAPDGLHLFGVRADARWVSAAWIRFPADNAFASLWGGATLPAYRRQGIYRSLLAARAELARARGRRFLTVDASPMSRPILERLGFRWIADSHPCTWPGGEAA